MNATTTQLPVALLWNYREFDRISKPAPQFGFFIQQTVEEIAADIEKNGLKNPIKLSIYNGKALITDGNHRLAVYKMTGREMIEVEVTYYDDESANSTFQPLTLSRFHSFNYSLLNLAA